MRFQPRRYGIACPEMFVAALLSSCVHHQPASPLTPAPPSQQQSSQDQVSEIVDGIILIEGLPPKAGERPADQHAAAIVALGKKAAPYLVERLTDTSPTRVVYGFPYEVGDIALVLLDEIYHPAGWPFPDDRIKIPQKYGDYRDYRDFVHSAGSRERLRQSWQEFIKDH
jgi:hypothetical protein